jgi:6-phosphofructokinase
MTSGPRTIGVITGGGDCPGLNAAMGIRFGDLA